MARKRQAESRGSWIMFAAAFPPELTESHPYFKASYAKLTGIMAEVERLGHERDAHNASKLAATRQRNELIRAGNQLVDVMQTALKDHLGADNEQLVAYGIKPFRGRKRAKKEAAAESPSPNAADPSEV